MKYLSDYLVLGSGIAGLTYALKAAETGTVTILTKKHRAESNTNYAQGGIASVTSKEDSFELHVADTLDAGAGLCREGVVRAIVTEGPGRIQELIDIGVRFSEREEVFGGGFDLGKEGGHSKRRVLHSKDMTGREIERALLQAIEEHPNIQVREDAVAIDLLVSDKMGMPGPRTCRGAFALNVKSGEVMSFGARATVLATGGCGKCYFYTTNPDIATGDGLAMAYRAGAQITNMEFIQFHPTCLYHPLSRSFLISEALRGEGGILVNEKGEEFMQQYDFRKSLAPRDITARAIDAEMKRTGAECMYLDMSSREPDFLYERFPNIHEYCEGLGIDMAEDPIPVVPAAHYQCGGVEAGIDGKTSIPGLYAIGEVACTGLHGANRLASNSLLEAVVSAAEASRTSYEELQPQVAIEGLPEWQSGDAHDPDEIVVVTHNWREIRTLMWDYVGIVRTDKRLERAANRLSILMKEIHDYYWDFKLKPELIELRNIALVSALIVDSAKARKESRGLHYTLDYPNLLERAMDTTLSKR
ncbi:MAG: L-aspartate oxidase [Verrucomicrobiota bacterium]